MILTRLSFLHERIILLNQPSLTSFGGGEGDDIIQSTANQHKVASHLSRLGLVWHGRMGPWSVLPRNFNERLPCFYIFLLFIECVHWR